MNFLIEFLRFLATFSVAFALGYFVVPRLVTRYLEYKDIKSDRKFDNEKEVIGKGDEILEKMVKIEKEVLLGNDIHRYMVALKRTEEEKANDEMILIDERKVIKDWEPSHVSVNNKGEYSIAIKRTEEIIRKAKQFIDVPKIKKHPESLDRKSL